MDTQLELYNTSWLQSLEALFLYAWLREPGLQVSLCVSGWQSGSRVKGNMVSDSYTTTVCVYYNTGRRNCS